MSAGQDQSRRPPEDYESYGAGALTPTSGMVKFANEHTPFTIGLFLATGLFAYRMLNVRRRPMEFGKVQALNQYMIHTRLYCCGAVVCGGTIEMFSDSYK